MSMHPAYLQQLGNERASRRPAIGQQQERPLEEQGLPLWWLNFLDRSRHVKWSEINDPTNFNPRVLR